MSFRLDATPGADDRQVWKVVRRYLQAYLAEQGLPLVSAELAPESPGPDPGGGQNREVWADLGNRQR